MRSFVVSCIGLALGSVTLAAQSRTPAQVTLSDVLPQDARPRQLALSADARRVYYTDSAGQIWLYDRAAKSTTRVANGKRWDLTLSPAGDALAYTKTGDHPREQYVWVLPLDARTGLAAGAERRASTMQGDVPAISPDGKWLAFARDDSTGVGQSVVIVPLPPGRGRERVLVPGLAAGVGNIRWTPDGHSVYFGVNPPVPCNPLWSCLPARGGTQPVAGTIRRVDVRGGAATIVARALSVWPGLSPDGSIIVYGDTGRARRIVVADTGGQRLDSFVLPAGQSMEGWVAGSTLLVSTSGTVRRVREHGLADGRARIVVDGLDGLILPAWSPDGRMISIVSWMYAPGNPRGELRIHDSDGSLRNVIPMPEQIIASSWSPDGRWIALATWTNRVRISAVEVVTGRMVRLDTTSGGSALRWLANSKGLIVSGYHGGDGGRRIAFSRVDLTGTTQLLREFPMAPTGFGGLALDSATAFLVRAGDGVRRVSLEGSGPDAVILPESVGFYAIPAFSGDGKWIAVRANRVRPENSRMNVLELLHPDGTGRVTIDLPFFAAPGDGNPVFVPGGGQLIVGESSDQGHEPGIYRLTVATMVVEKLFSIPIGFWYRPDLALSPDGRTLLYVTSENIAPRLFTMDLSSVRSASRH